MNKFCAYGCISTVKIGLNDAKRIKQTKAYKEIFDELQNMFIHPDDITIDVITGSYRKRKKFDETINSFGYGDSIVIANISSLGYTTNELITNYVRLYEKRIGLLIPDYSKENSLSEYSTTSFGFEPISLTANEFDELCNKLENEKITTNQGRMKNGLPMPERFAEVYWAYENYFIDEQTALSNQFFSLPKRRFRDYCEEYEKTEAYVTEQLKQEDMYHISEKPKRYGAVPACFPVLADILHQGVDLSEACNQLNVPVITDIDYRRYEIKFNGGNPNRSIMIRAAHYYKQKYQGDLTFVPPRKL